MEVRTGMWQQGGVQVGSQAVSGAQSGAALGVGGMQHRDHTQYIPSRQTAPAAITTSLPSPELTLGQVLLKASRA